MSRPKKCRFIQITPDITYFKPRGVPMFQLEEVGLTVDELEALRLHDVMNLTEEKACKKMRVSRTTFHRLIASAQKKVSEALVKGKAIRIEGGYYEIRNKK